MLAEAVFAEACVLVVEEFVLQEGAELLVEVVVGAPNQLPGEPAIVATIDVPGTIADGDLRILGLGIIAADAAAEVGLELVEGEAQEEIPHKRAAVQLRARVEVR